ncbi:MAG: UDP-N-acetylmuramoyl-L-alanyl-D-glutamate--2,6-diaminopimelate ligase [Mycoplasmatales bacterium]
MYTGITKNSKEVKPGYIYCCFEGRQVSGYEFIEEALKNGAVKIIGEKNLQIKYYEQVDNINQAMINYSKEIYHFPDKKLKLIGITGTDGKTSTALIIDYLLNQKSQSSYLGTNGFFIKQEEVEYSGFTTPFADKLYSYFAQSVNQDSKYFVMEVSSHALQQKRVLGLNYQVGIFNNLSAEHLDFHRTMEDYYQAKKQLFEQLAPNGYAIINIDDEYGKRLKSEINNKILTISNKNQDADYYFTNESLALTNSTFDLFIHKQKYQIVSPLLAKFNIYNLVQAIATVQCLGYNLEDINDTIKNLVIPGRLESVPNNQNLNIIIDFAHTADAINKVMEFIKNKQQQGKIHVLTGSAGQRDQEKRPLMGEYAAKYADFLYLTEDDPRDEAVKSIITDLKKGVKNKQCQIIEEENRQKAISNMIQNAKPLDTLILFGKGSMKVMYYNNYTEKYIEKEVVQSVLKGE